MIRNRIKDVVELAAPAQEPVSLQEVKDFLRVSFADDDAVISGMITGARQLLEKRLNIFLAVRSLKVTFSHDGCSAIALPYGPVGNITASTFKYDLDDTLTITTSTYTIIGDQFKQFKGAAGWWTITYDAGYVTAPEALRQGVLKQVAWMYENRGDTAKTGQLNTDVLYMLAGYDKNAWI
ncbi:head-tail connector protein [Chitinophaga rhizosphaerae]|uniref:head-tail connector protein n=1 Tax=Chitinophaga rhizosphaerae TaxID=1864947 RepID=UPI000F804730|nr:phage head-tail connector protein [Chitinophaga rhizosphaerae]